MAELPDNVDLQWVGRQVIALQQDVRMMRNDLDMLTKLAVRVDRSVDALREDIRTIWMSHRIETLENRT